MSYPHLSTGRPQRSAGPANAILWPFPRWTARPVRGNASALVARLAWWCAVAGVVPGVGLVFGLLAVILGLVAAPRTLRDEDGTAVGRTLAAIGIGSAEILLNAVLLACVLAPAGA